MRVCHLRSLGTFVLLIVFGLVLPSPGFGLPWQGILEELKKVQAGAEGRMRYEWWSGLEPVSGGERDYDFYNLRLRPYLLYPGELFTFFFQFQYAGSFDLPENGISGPGVGYFSLSSPERNPQATDVLEFYMEARNFPVEGLGFRLGRQGIREGAEVLYDDPVFEWLKKARLSERLVGTWDGPNVGRRFDAVDLSFSTQKLYVDGFAAKVLAGGPEYGSAMSPLDEVSLLGASLIAKKDAFLRGTELRIFEIYYHDDRKIAKAFAGDGLEIHSFGASLVGVYPGMGPGLVDLIVWGCYQWGDWGTTDHSAYAVLSELGYQLSDVTAQPWLRAGITHASGDDDPVAGPHKTFFNVTPTNHKFYGYMDLTSLSNLFNFYLQLLFHPAEKLLLQVDGHLFWLHRYEDSWYAGSGAASNGAFGFAGGYDVSTGSASRKNGR